MKESWLYPSSHEQLILQARLVFLYPQNEDFKLKKQFQNCLIKSPKKLFKNTEYKAPPLQIFLI